MAEGITVVFEYGTNLYHGNFDVANRDLICNSAGLVTPYVGSLVADICVDMSRNLSGEHTGSNFDEWLKKFGDKIIIYSRTSENGKFIRQTLRQALGMPEEVMCTER
jgi:hypothetical protein